MASIQIKGLDQLVGRLDDQGKQARFALVQAINATAKDVQAATLAEFLPQAFTLRSRGQPWQTPGTKFGFNIRPFASKAAPTATIGSQADWLRLQEAGGTKSGAQHRIAVPTSFLKEKKEIVSRQKKPRAILRSRAALARITGRAWIPEEGGKLPQGIWARTTKARLPIKRLYTFLAAVNIKGVLHYETRGASLAEKKFAGHFATAFTRALATAK